MSEAAAATIRKNKEAAIRSHNVTPNGYNIFVSSTPQYNARYSKSKNTKHQD